MGSGLGPKYRNDLDAPEGMEGWHALPLRDPLDDVDEEDMAAAMRSRDATAKELGEWLMACWTEEERQFFVAVEWVNCHEHALVNTFVKMSENANERACVELGPTKLEYFKKVIEGSKAKMPTVDGADKSDENLAHAAATIDAKAVILNIPSGNALAKEHEELLTSMDNLLRENMLPFTNSKGLSTRQDSLRKSYMRTVAVVSSSGELKGFAAYSLKQMEGTEETDYLYELHIAKGARGKGLGSMATSTTCTAASSTTFASTTDRVPPRAKL